MIPFTYARASSVDEAIELSSAGGHSLLGGGTNLIDLMRKGVERPVALIDASGLSQTIEETGDGGLMIGAAARNSAVAGHAIVRERYPVLSRAILAGASAQIRNMATVAGNIMQRTRCAYFVDTAGSRCNKRLPGSGCDALGGFNRYHAIIGGSSACIATHPSDMCVALAALNAQVHVRGPAGVRIVPFVDFHLLPGEAPHVETLLESGEMIISIELPAAPSNRRSAYRKVRDRASYAFALFSVAACVTMRDGVIHDTGLAFGGIAPKPWRAIRAEEALRGAIPQREAFASAVAVELESAIPLSGNAFKMELAKRTTASVLADLTGETR